MPKIRRQRAKRNWYRLRDHVVALPWNLRSGGPKYLPQHLRSYRYYDAKCCAKAMLHYDLSVAMKIDIISGTIRTDPTIFEDFCKYNLLLKAIQQFFAESATDVEFAARTNVLSTLREYIFAVLAPQMIMHHPQIWYDITPSVDGFINTIIRICVQKHNPKRFFKDVCMICSAISKGSDSII